VQDGDNKGTENSEKTEAKEGIEDKTEAKEGIEDKTEAKEGMEDS
jgi:hypothetical protein